VGTTYYLDYRINCMLEYTPDAGTTGMLLHIIGKFIMEILR
jgi:hypothetical protein